METLGFAINNKKYPVEDISANLFVREKVDFLLHLADTNLILAQRNAGWCGHGPILEQDIAITNISLDLLGQARNFYQYAALLLNQLAANAMSNATLNFQESGTGIRQAPSPLEMSGGEVTEFQDSLEKHPAEVTEDTLAYLRTEREFKNLLITELPRGDWAQNILRQFFCSAYQFLLYEQLIKTDDVQLAAIAEKSIKEVTYHLKWTSEWVIRLGDGTSESHQRMLTAFGELWPYTGEFFMPAGYEKKDITAVDTTSLNQPWIDRVTVVFKEATLGPIISSMAGAGFMQSGGKNGIHTEHMGILLAEMQYLQRTYPGANW